MGAGSSQSEKGEIKINNKVSEPVTLHLKDFDGKGIQHTLGPNSTFTLDMKVGKYTISVYPIGTREFQDAKAETFYDFETIRHFETNQAQPVTIDISLKGGFMNISLDDRGYSLKRHSISNNTQDTIRVVVKNPDGRFFEQILLPEEIHKLCMEDGSANISVFLPEGTEPKTKYDFDVKNFENRCFKLQYESYWWEASITKVEDFFNIQLVEKMKAEPYDLKGDMLRNI